MPNENDSIKIKDVIKIIDAVKNNNENDLVKSSDKVLRYIESRSASTRSEILRANWRHVSRDDLETIMVTLLQAGLIEEIALSNKIVYRSTT